MIVVNKFSILIDIIFTRLKQEFFEIKLTRSKQECFEAQVTRFLTWVGSIVVLLVL